MSGVSAAGQLRLIELQASILRRVASDRPIAATLDSICDEVAVTFPGSIPAIVVLDQAGTHLSVATPNRVPEEVLALINSTPVSQTALASGDVITRSIDTSADSEVWDDFGPRPNIGLEGVWSSGLKNESGEPFGGLILLWENHSPALASGDVIVLDLLADMAASALVRHQVQRDSISLIGEERTRIAGDLQVDPVQAMTAVALQLQRLCSQLHNDAQQDLASQVLEGANSAVARLQAMVFELHPANLTGDGLLEAFATYLESNAEPLGITWAVDGESDRRLSPSIEALGFRLGREALSNALRHASPTRVAVEVTNQDLHLGITLSDDGVGFEPSKTSHQLGHLGIAHATALASSAGGTFAVESGIGEGTVVRISLPVILNL